MRKVGVACLCVRNADFSILHKFLDEWIRSGFLRCQYSSATEVHYWKFYNIESIHSRQSLFRGSLGIGCQNDAGAINASPRSVRWCMLIWTTGSNPVYPNWARVCTTKSKFMLLHYRMRYLHLCPCCFAVGQACYARWFVASCMLGRLKKWHRFRHLHQFNYPPSQRINIGISFSNNDLLHRFYQHKPFSMQQPLIPNIPPHRGVGISIHQRPGSITRNENNIPLKIIRM